MKTNHQKILLATIFAFLISMVVYYFWGAKVETSDTIVDDLSIDIPVQINDSIKMISVPFNLPSELKGHHIIKRSFYTFSYNEKHEQPDWIAYTLYPIADSLRVKRKDHFRIDPLVKTGSATLKDYKRSGYDRGHLAPAKAMSYSKEAMSASFYMSNMSPQIPSFNRGIWKKLEAKIYELSLQSDSLYVVTGPVFKEIIDSIGVNKVSVPKYYYKTILRFQKDTIYGLGFLLENKKSSQSYFDFVVSIDSIEKLTGIDFYTRLDSLKQKKLESNTDFTMFRN
tara:strand:- start:3148 stop:3993 length:846 start_codon:yes stop_codon:yes gene_type:complete